MKIYDSFFQLYLSIDNFSIGLSKLLKKYKVDNRERKYTWNILGEDKDSL